jgi:5'-phosphate synthase pdxT subunit
MKIGVLALQGDFIEHVKMFEKLEQKAVEIRLPHQLHDIEGLLIPGGESTTMMNLMQSFDLINPIKKLAEDHVAIWGTCAGLICVAKKVCNPDSTDMETLGLMNITVMRNAFGRQVDSFEIGLQITGLPDGPFPGVFIRAPYIEKVGQDMEVLARLPDGEIVAAREGKMLATSFHPDLTGSTGISWRSAGAKPGCLQLFN